jgi:plastocyanin
MSNTNKVMIAIVIVVVVAVGAWLVAGNKSDQITDTAPPAADTSNENEQVVAATITYDGTAFNPATISVKSGTKVKIMNQSQKEMEFASNDHPTHLKNSELNIGDIAPGGSKTFTASTKGTWGFHDHYNSSKGGTITVE